MPTLTDVQQRLVRLAGGVPKLPRAQMAGEAEWLSAAIDDLAEEGLVEPEALMALWGRLARALDPRALRPMPAGLEDVRHAARLVAAQVRMGGAGRPGVGVTVEVRLPASSADGIDHWRTAWGLTSTAEAHRRIVAAGLEALGDPPSG